MDELVAKQQQHLHQKQEPTGFIAGGAIQPEKYGLKIVDAEISKSSTTKNIMESTDKLLPPNITISPSISKSAPASPMRPSAGGSMDSPEYMKKLLSPLKVNPKLRELMDMQLSPLTTTSTTSTSADQQRCFICWETSQQPQQQDMVIPCQCKNINLKYAHKNCIEHWVNENHKTHCNVCMTEYSVKLKPMPWLEIFMRNRTIILSFSAQILLPVVLYGLLYYWGVLNRVSGWIVLGHFSMLLILYSTFAVQVFRKLNRHHRKVENFRDSPP